MQLHELKIDQEFHDLIPPLSPEEYNLLEANILEENAVRDPIIVWRGENIIVDGHNRYRILSEHPDIPYSVLEKDFDSRDEVILWICRNQIGRRNLSPFQKDYLLGMMIEARKSLSHGSEFKERNADGTFKRASKTGMINEIIAKEQGIKASYVKDAGRFARGLNEVEAAYPGTIRKVTSGELEVTKKDVQALTTMSKEDKPEAIKAIAEGKRIPDHNVRRGSILDIPPATPLKRDMSYNADDFREDLKHKVLALDKSLEVTVILTHKDLLDTEEGKEVLRDTLLQMTEVIKKYLELC